MRSARKSTDWLVLCAAAVLPIIALGAGCAHFFSAGPSNVSPEGVRLTIRNYECLQVPETGDPHQGADLVVDMEINNQSDLPLVVRTGAMQVDDADGGSMARRGWNQKGPVQVDSGRNQKLTMHFVGSPKHCCSSRLALNPSGVTVGERTLAMTPINFVPECLF
jgi:hypothetical protein